MDHQFAAVVLLGIAEEQCGGQVGAHAFGAVAYLTHRVVDVIAKLAACRVAVEQGRKDLARQRGRHELRVLPEPLQHGFGNLAGEWVVLLQLQIVFGLGRLIASGDAAVLPVGLFQRGANTVGFFSGEHIGNA